MISFLDRLQAKVYQDVHVYSTTSHTHRMFVLTITENGIREIMLVLFSPYQASCGRIDVLMETAAFICITKL